MADDPPNAPSPEARHVSRLELVWNVVVFQFKLGLDGLRDVLLIPLSIFSAILGLAAGGDEPDRYFKQLLRFGRQTENWLNLFDHPEQGDTSDDLIRPLQHKVFDHARTSPWLNKASARLNRGLDQLNASVDSRRSTGEVRDEKSEP